MKKLFCLLLVISCFNSCKDAKNTSGAQISGTDVLHDNMKQLTGVIMLDAFGPTAACRIYVYTNLAAYEAIRFDKAGYPSLTAQLNGFPEMPMPEKSRQYNYLLAATKAFHTVAENITFSKDSLVNHENMLYEDFRDVLDEETFNRSVSLGDSIGKCILQRAAKDNYKQTRGMPKFLGSNSAGKWRPTPPDYLDGAEPNWGMIKTIAIDSPAEFVCPPPPAYSTDKNSPFYQEANGVYNITKGLTEEQKTISRYWDDNPFVIEHSGHLMYANKKITPPGHWMGITGIAAKSQKLNAVETAQAFALTAAAMFDTFIACWDVKYRTQVVRPVTVINELIDPNWLPMLQTPPFPEYTSGHSGISAAAATVLSQRFGQAFAFEDTSDLEFIGMKRSFASFKQAAQEASISRVYGGIHYRNSVDAGAQQGISIGEYINRKIKLRTDSRVSLD